MENEIFYRLAFLLLVILILSVRLFGHMQAGTLTQPRQSYKEGVITKILRPLPLLILIGAVLYILDPQLMAWSSVRLPDWVRLVGIIVGFGSVIGMAWVHSALNKQFSGRLEIRDDHALVKNGPYRWVRHPMYTVTLAMFFSIFLITANWFIGLGGLLQTLVVVIARTPREEAMLLETFGDDYRIYMQETPRYIPWLF